MPSPAPVALAVPSAIERLPISALTFRKSNARTHSKAQLRQIAESIRVFGFTNPVLIDANNEIIAGHGRVQAAKLLGMDSVPVIRLEHLTPDQVRAYVIADNRLAEKAGWDKAILAIELQHLLTIDADFDVTITGFEVSEIDLLIEGQAKAEAEEDPPEPGPPVTQLGDLWTLGPHRLLCGDALSADAYERLLDDERAHAVFTDPPYNVRIDGHAGGLGKVHHREFAMATGEMTEEAFTRFLRKAFARLASHSQPGALHFICMDWRHAFELLSAGREVYSEFKNLCVWAKDNAGMGSLYRSQHELVFVFKHGTAPHRNNVQLGQFGRHRSNVWNYPSMNMFARKTDEGRLAGLHPTVKPVDLVADALLDCTARGEIVLDPFLGSGSTLIAAQRVGRLCRGMELDPLYVDVAIRRWQRHTGETAVHAVTGKRFNDVEAQPEGAS